MKNLRHFLTTLVATLFLFFSMATIKAQDAEVFKEDIKVEIYKKTTRAEIDAIVMDLSQKGIDLYIDKLVYSENGKRIKDIAGRIDCNDDTQGSFNGSGFFRKIEIQRNHSPDAPVSFSIKVN